jgi:hypothetical protein
MVEQPNGSALQVAVASIATSVGALVAVAASTMGAVVAVASIAGATVSVASSITGAVVSVASSTTGAVVAVGWLAGVPQAARAMLKTISMVKKIYRRFVIFFLLWNSISNIRRGLGFSPHKKRNTKTGITPWLSM